MKDFNKVVGLQYEAGEGLPRVVLKGSGRIADEILRTRNHSKTPQIIENSELVDKLYRLPVEAEIGEDLYDLVALLLVHVFSVNEKLKGGKNG